MSCLLSCAYADATEVAVQAAAQEPASAAEGKGEEEAEAAGQEQGDQAQVSISSPCLQTVAVLTWCCQVSRNDGRGLQECLFGLSRHVRLSSLGLCMLQEITAPGTPPPQARMSRFGAAQAGRQGTGQSSAAQHGDQPPSGPNDQMQEANPYRSLGKPS